MLIFVTAVGVVLVASFLCSIFESVLLSLTRSQVELLGRRHEAAARLMTSFKQNIDVNRRTRTVTVTATGQKLSDVLPLVGVMPALGGFVLMS